MIGLLRRLVVIFDVVMKRSLKLSSNEMIFEISKYPNTDLIVFACTCVYTRFWI